MTKQELYAIADRIGPLKIFGKDLLIHIKPDQKGGERLYIQLSYFENCKESGQYKPWYGRKWYLSEHMTPDEVIKTTFAAFKAIVEHEVMEAFTVDGITLFNPHVNFEELLKISHKEIKRV